MVAATYPVICAYSIDGFFYNKNRFTFKGNCSMDYIVLDLEWNQAMHSNETKKLQFEIIEIGAVKLNQELKETGRFSRLVKPVLYKKVNPIIEEITGIQGKDFQKEKGFASVIEEFLDWCGEDYIFCTFGSQDIHELEMNMLYHKCEIPWSFPLKYIDVQKVFGIEQKDEFEQRSLEMVSIYLGIKQQNVYHRAFSDALYTAEILRKMDMESIMKYQSLDYVNLPLTKKEEIEIDLGNHFEYVTRAFDKKEDLLNYTDLYVTRCPVCRKKCRKKIRWFSDSTKYLCVARCEKHGLMEGIINIKKQHNEKYFGLRKVTSIDEEKLQAIIKRKDLLREKRRLKRQREKKNSN